MYGKWFASAYSGSMVGAGAVPYAVLPYAVANARWDGVAGTCSLNPPIVAAILGCTVAEVESAIEYLCAPDIKSKNPASHGARLVKTGPFAYEIVSYADYRRMRNEEDRRAQDRERKRRTRADTSGHMADGADKSAMSAQEEEEEEEEEEIRSETALSSAARPTAPAVSEQVGAEPTQKQRETAGIVRRVYDHWRSKTGHVAAKLTAPRRRLVEARLREGYTEAQLLAAVDGIASSAWHRGENDRATRYDDLGLILRTGAHVEKHAALDSGPAEGAITALRRERDEAIERGDAGTARAKQTAIDERLSRAYNQARETA